MAWEWSHTEEAYVNAEQNLRKKSAKWLAVCLAEITSSDIDEHYNYEFNSDVYEANLKTAKSYPKAEIASSVWNFAKQNRTCNNGGFDAWMCPFGCHTVSFSKGG